MYFGGLMMVLVVKWRCCWQQRTMHLMRIVMHTPKALYLNYRAAGLMSVLSGHGNESNELCWATNTECGSYLSYPECIAKAGGPYHHRTPSHTHLFAQTRKAHHHLVGTTHYQWWYNQSRVLCLPIKLISLPHRIHKRVVNNSAR